jgi:predicted ribosome quality control (RQC) complex YloA/Tae2 family protein
MPGGWETERRDVGSKGRGYRAYDLEGFEVLVGKGDADNDRLTFGVAAPGDLWLHVAGPAGSHVVVRNPDELDVIPRPVVEQAAQLAAWHSKARGGRGKVEVHVCRVADVRKPRGFPPGQVLLKRWDAVKVYARDPVGGGEGE